MQRQERITRKSGARQIILTHISENINLYFKVLIVLIIGICIGIAVVNQLPEAEKKNINEYIYNSITVLKKGTEISKIQILRSSLFKNIAIVLSIWFFGLSVFGSFVLYFITLVIGITFGYTLSSIMTCFTFIQGILFFFTGMLIHNIINIPSTLFLIVQGMKSHKSILNKQKTSIKHIFIKHSAYSILVMILLIIASFVEVYISGNLVYIIAKYL